MAVKKEDILEAISQMSVMDVVDLISAMEEKFGVTAQAAVAAVAAPKSGGGDVAEEKSSFDIELSEVGASKVAVIKVVRNITGLGLKEAKEKVDGAPSVIKEGVAKKDTDDIVKQLEEAGAKVTLK